ncbi:DUF4156 domain-containing protein [Francisellaceae bacterium]|nr:DUF4156 domain-containing protein [Francisellaceae bacterium]
MRDLLLTKYYLILLTIFMTGCSWIPADKLTSDAAKHVIISIDTPHENCRFIGNIFGSQGNWISGFFTSNLDISLGAINNLRNEAADNGANYVYFGQLYASDVSILRGAFDLNIVTTPLKTITGTFNATYYGEAYHCPTLKKITIRTPPHA